jgi:hypothetical protein
MSNLNEEKKLLKKVIVEHLSSINLYGFPKIFKAENLALKILWILCFIVSASFCMVMLVSLSQYYYSFPIILKTNLVQEIPAKFPMVSLCNMKRLNLTKSFDFLISSGTIYPLQSFLVDPSNLGVLGARYYLMYQMKKNFSFTELKNMGFLLEEMLISCQFNYNTCDKSDFTYFYSSYYGNCYSFNSGRFENGSNSTLKKSILAGKPYGLTIELFIGNPEIDTMLDSDDGIYISIDNQTSVPFTKDNILTAEAGGSTDFIIERNFIKNLEKPYGICVPETNVANYKYMNYIINTLGVSYTHNYCFKICLQDLIIQSCNCSSIFLPTYNIFVSNYCDVFDDVICQLNTLSSHDTSYCHTECPLECDSIDYHSSTSKSLYPTKSYASVLYSLFLRKKINISRDDISQAVTKVNIYYEKLEYKTTEENILISPLSYFSNIMSQMNFFIGFNVFTLVEILEFLIILVFSLLSFIKRGNQTRILPSN